MVWGLKFLNNMLLRGGGQNRQAGHNGSFTFKVVS